MAKRKPTAPVTKNRSYAKRFRVKYRRRRQGKTNYLKRKKLIAQDKNKYNTPKHRFVVRKTNRDIICQVYCTDMTHDECFASAHSHELTEYGIKVGLTNYPAAYCTGLLLARRVNLKLKKDIEGNTQIDGNFFIDEDSGAFKVYLDSGLQRITTGANMFGALKGAVDGGLNIPHNTRRFPGSTCEPNPDGKKEWEYDPETHRKRIFGEHIVEYMNKLKDKSIDDYTKQFSQYIKNNIESSEIVNMYKSAHKKIRENPNIKRDPMKLGYFKIRDKKKDEGVLYEKKRYNQKKMSGKEKKINALKKLKEIGEKMK